MLGKPHILSLSPTCFLNSIKHDYSCKILYINYLKFIVSYQAKEAISIQKVNKQTVFYVFQKYHKHLSKLI